jgi:hypothetical protein
MADYCEECSCVVPYNDWICDNCFDVKEDDIIEKPSHYSRWNIEPITYIMRNGMEFWRGNLIKYSSRAGYKTYDGKTQEESEVLDLEKVKRYCDMRINQINGEEVL